MGKAQELVTALRARAAAVSEEFAATATLDVDRDAVAQALVSFDELWSVLLTQERARVLQLLIERIDYDGASGKLNIRWRLAGLGQFADELGRGTS